MIGSISSRSWYSTYFRSASWFVPPQRRGEWLLEWQGELWYQAHDRAQPFGLRGGIKLVNAGFAGRRVKDTSRTSLGAPEL